MSAAKIASRRYGLREAFAILDSLAVQMSGHAYRGAPDTIEPAVTDLRRVTSL